MARLPRNPIRGNVRPYTPPGLRDSRGIPPRRPIEPEPPPIPAGGHVVRHLIEIDRTVYSLAVLPRRAGDAALRVWQARKLSGDRAVYQVSELPAAEGWSACTCGDWHYRCEGRGLACKHVLAIGELVRLGHLPAPPELAPPPAVDPPEGLSWADFGDRWACYDPHAEGDPFEPTPAMAVGASLERGS